MSTFTLQVCEGDFYHRNPVGISRVFLCVFPPKRKEKEKTDPSCYDPLHGSFSFLTKTSILNPWCRWKDTEFSPFILWQHWASRFIVAGLSGTTDYTHWSLLSTTNTASVIAIHHMSTLLPVYHLQSHGSLMLQIKFFTGGALPSCLGVVELSLTNLQR